MARTQTLDEWAVDEFTIPIPSMPTLLKYAQNGMIFPPPFKAGRCWRVDKTARFIGMSDKPVIKKNDSPRLMRILEDGTTP
ncbi:excisionase [Serratia sp. Leaf50]|uniref:excisionase n=1 Tax=Rouxiella sp. S1S-2 TaxID=2653856 RepID=UPI0006F86DCD|nr:excisionase [Rouxiella sp. S1S-2]KAB7895984.1 excisionase [Rouxiella sp. S1S-2]KQN46916.1 excisionase [Serratia sp. Leaf50]